MYTIDSPVTDKERLRDVVTKHCLSLDRFLSNTPIADHNQEAFSKLKSIIPPNATLILDSGCGTGLSTRRIAASLWNNGTSSDANNTWVLGVDRSLIRLERNSGFREQQQQQQDQAKRNEESEKKDQKSDIPWTNNHDVNEKGEYHEDDVFGRVLWMRMECVDLWRLILQYNRQEENPAAHHWNIQTHYLLYPNPYPKAKRWKSRWYGHPSFPLLLQLGGDIVIRSNWETYLNEFAQAVLFADEAWTATSSSSGTTTTTNWARPYVKAAHKGPVQRVVPTNTGADYEDGWSNFELKYDHVGETTFELLLTRSDRDG
jgi:SAM-dependent methyltransferase